MARRLKGSAPLAKDVTVVHPFTQTSDTTQHDRVSSAELAKHRHYDELCRSSGFSFNACGFSTFGGAAPDALLVLRHVKDRIMEKHGKSEGHLLYNQAGERIVVALMRGIAAKLIEGSTHAEQLVNTPSEQDPILATPQIQTPWRKRTLPRLGMNGE